jgi:predicted DNA-binding transcriptional regulator AlpA
VETTNSSEPTTENPASPAVAKKRLRRSRPLPEEAPDENTRYLNTRQLAALLGISHVTLEWWRRGADGPPFIKFTAGQRARVVYDRKDIERWLDARKRGGGQ